MMGSTVLCYIQSVWPFSTFKDGDLRESDGLVRKLKVPDETKQFVFAIQEPESQAVIYILCVQNLSERSSLDAEHLIRNVRPGAVVVQVNEIQSQEVELFGSISGGDGDSCIPTSSFEVLKRCFLDKANKEKYENVAGSLVLREIFGVGFHGHSLAAKRMAKEVGSHFLLLESPFVKLDGGNNPSGEADSGNKFQALAMQPSNFVSPKVDSMVPSGLRMFSISNDIHSEMLKSLCSHLLHLSSTPNVSSVDIQPRVDYEVPQFARSVYPLLVDLHNIFLDIPSIGRALAHAQKMLYDVNKGETVDSQLLSGVYVFRIAVEGLRIALNNAGRVPINKMRNLHSAKTEFSALPVEEKSHAVLAHALRSQTDKFKSIVAIVDASVLAGLRKHWNTPVPPEVKDIVEELVADCMKDGETPNYNDKKRRLTNKPVVAVGAGATAVLGASSLSKVVPVSTFVKVVTFKVPASLKLMMTQTQKLVSISIGKFLGSSKVIAPGIANSGVKTSAMKATASAEKIRAVVHSVIASAEKTSLSAMRTAFYEIMRNHRGRPIGVVPWATFGFSVAACTSLLVYGDGIECAVESLPAAPSIASLGRGIQSLRQASQAVQQAESSRIQKSIDSLVHRFNKWKAPQ